MARTGYIRALMPVLLLLSSLLYCTHASRLVQHNRALKTDWTPDVNDAPNPNIIKGTYIGWVGHQNFGDELTFAIFMEQFRIAVQNVINPKAIVYLKYEQNVRKGFPQKAVQDGQLLHNARDFVILGGGTMVMPYWLQLFQTVQNGTGNMPVMLFGSGTGVTEANLLEEVADSLAGENISGGVRGPHTQSLLKQAGVQVPVFYDAGLVSGVFINQDMDVFGDLLLKPDELYVMVTPPGGQHDNAPQFNMDWYVDFVLKLSERWVVVLQPCDATTDTEYHRFQIQVIQRQLAAQEEDDVEFKRVLVNNQWANFAKTFALFAQAQLSVVARFHPSPVSLSTLTPTLFTCYTPPCAKYQDLVKIIGDDRFLVQLDGSEDPEEMRQLCISLANKLDEKADEVINNMKASMQKMLEVQSREMESFVTNICDMSRAKCEAIASGAHSTMTVSAIKYNDGAVVEITPM